ncbi:MAG: hypothetical protein J7484_05315, partial [Microbacterium sp.]|nr:hypothetical protein [Microbacterium sp.]
PDPRSPASAAVPPAPEGGADLPVRARTTPAPAVPAAPTPVALDNVLAPAASAPVSAPTAADPAASAQRPVAAQVSPVVVSIVQRPVGTHQLTLTVNPESLGPVTVRAHIGRGGDVQVELLGVTDAGRDALRAIVADLRRDLAAVIPHATLTVGHGAGADVGADRGQGSAGQAQGDRGGDAAKDPGHDRQDPRTAPARALDLVPGIHPSTRAGSGEGLDTFA